MVVGTLAGAGMLAGMENAAAQTSPARVNVSVGADSVKVGEPFTLSLTAEHNFSTEVRFPESGAGPLVFGDLEVLSRDEVSERYVGAEGPGLRVDSITYRVATFALDSARIPPIPVEVIVGRDTVLVSSRQRRVPVRSTVGPDDGLQGLAPLAAFPQPLWPYVLLAIAAIAALGGLAYWWRSSGEAASADGEPVPAPEEPPIGVLHERLDRLQKHNLGDPAQIESFYVELSKALRTYLAHRLGVAALERTTREVADTLARRPDVPGPERRRIQAVLEVADLVKFADARPSPSDGKTALREARIAADAIESALRPESADESEPVESA